MRLERTIKLGGVRAVEALLRHFCMPKVEPREMGDIHHQVLHCSPAITAGHLCFLLSKG